jgi:hypothetical protein
MIVLGSAGRAVGCDIVDVGGGARIQLDAERLTPGEFELVAGGVISFRARVVWRERAAVGVAFDGMLQRLDPGIVRLPRRT